MEKLERMESGEPDADVLRTGISGLDKHSPLRLGDMPLIVGERKAGKSILSLTVAINTCRDNAGVLYFSLEDKEPKLIDRIFAGASRIPMDRHHLKLMTQADFAAMRRTVTDLPKTDFVIRDDVQDLGSILAVARQEKSAQPNLQLIVVDYAQLVCAPVRKSDSREREVAMVSRSLRLLAMELNVALLLLSQLNKDGESRESRALEQDATACWQLNTVEDQHSRRTLSIPWQRNGESGVFFPVTFLGHIARVENHADEQRPLRDFAN